MNLKDTKPFCKVGDKLEFEVVSITDLFGTIHYSMQSNDINVLFKNSNPNQENWKPKMVEATQWIPCSERLPECEWGAETEALMYQVGDTIYTGYFGRGGLWRDEYFRRYADIKEGVDASDVIAWMPLPEQYKEEE